MRPPPSTRAAPASARRSPAARARARRTSRSSARRGSRTPPPARPRGRPSTGAGRSRPPGRCRGRRPRRPSRGSRRAGSRAVPCGRRCRAGSPQRRAARRRRRRARAPGRGPLGAKHLGPSVLADDDRLHSAPSGDTRRPLAPDHAAPRPTLALAKAPSLGLHASAARGLVLVIEWLAMRRRTKRSGSDDRLELLLVLRIVGRLGVEDLDLPQRRVVREDQLVRCELRIELRRLFLRATSPGRCSSRRPRSGPRSSGRRRSS